MTDRESPLDAAVLDRMVDGELDETTERELLARLDGEPEGWRKLALAYVESQVFGRELPAAVAAIQTPVSDAAKPTPQTASWSDVGWQLVSIASTLLLSFGLGLWVRGFWPMQIDGGGGPVQSADLTGRSRSAIPGADVDRPKIVVTDKQRKAHGDREAPSTLRMVDHEGKTFEVPVLTSSQFDPSWLADDPSLVPRDVRKAFERSGHEIRERRQFVPVRLKDGRHVIVPVDQVELHYVGRPVQ